MKKSSKSSQKPALDNPLDNKGAPRGDFEKLGKLNYLISTWFENVAIVAIVGIIVSNLVDVIGAKLFNKPIAAGTEIVYFLQVIAMAGALAVTKIDGKHIRLEFVDSLPARLKNVFHFISALLGLALFVLLFWKGIEYTQALKATQEVTAVSRIALYPFTLWLSICCIPLCLVLLKELLQSARGVVKG
jgi:TRAP-type C4-dicarboxylate transport system permease small subunit